MTIAELHYENKLIADWEASKGIEAHRLLLEKFPLPQRGKNETYECKDGLLTMIDPELDLDIVEPYTPILRRSSVKTMRMEP